MITIRNKTLNRIKDWTNETIHILTDFDYTITSQSSITSWHILAQSNLMPASYVEERQKLYEFYRPLELDETLSLEEKNQYMSDWWEKHMNLLIKYKVTEDIINEAVKNPKIFKFRPGAKKFLKLCEKKKIPVIIISAGIGNFIEQFLINNNCNYDNIYIVSNFLEFKNNVVTGMKETIIHSLNKNEAALSNEIKEVIKNRQNIILLGDNTQDVKMARDESRENALKIGFLDEKVEENKPYYEKYFDIICTDSSYNELLNILPIK